MKTASMLPFTGILSVLVLGCLWIAFAPDIHADGKVFAPVLVPQQVEMPDQRALLAWHDGIETLVIESAFVGEGSDFAWIVPLPSKPEVFPATRGTLPSAVALMQPLVATPWPEAWSFACVLGLLGLAALVFGWASLGAVVRVLLMLLILCLVAAIIGATTRSLFVFYAVVAVGCACAWPFRRWLWHKSSMREVLLSLLAAAALSSVFLTSLGTVRSFGTLESGIPAVTVEQSQVGDHDVALISGRDGDGVIAWLEANGFAVSPAERKVAAEHTEAGGWFVASRVHRTFIESGRSMPAPLAFRFPTETPLYPMRLTGADATRPLKVELIVFGPSRAATAGLDAHAAARLTHATPEVQMGYRREFPGQSKHDRKITHPELVRWTQGATMATRLKGELSPEAMQDDLVIRWTGDREAKGLFVHTADDALAHSLFLGAILCFAGAMILGLRFGNGVLPRRWMIAIILIAVSTTGVHRFITPTIPSGVTSDRLALYYLQRVAEVAAQALFELPPDADDDRVRGAFAALLREQPDLAKKFRIGDAPGEVMLTKLPAGVWQVWFFDAYGQPVVLKGFDITVGG